MTRDDAFGDPGEALLFSYVAGECTAEERQRVDAWCGESAANARRVEELRRIWGASPASPARDVDRMWTRFRGAIDESTRTADPGESVRVPVRRAGIGQLGRRRFSAGVWAAALVVLVGGTLVLRRAALPAAAGPTVPPHVYATGPAQTAHVRLGDGTLVTLAPQSRLLVRDDYGRSERLVTIEGQGFFDVVHSAAKPFRVRAKGAVAQDLGTRFDLRAYADERGVTVIVTDGAVTLGRARLDSTAQGAEGVVVRRGERARLDSASGMATVDRVSLHMMEWTGGKLSFVDAPLAEIANAVGRWYDLDVRVDAMLAQRPVTADFSTQSPREMLEVLATAVDATVEQHGRVVTIEARP